MVQKKKFPDDIFPCKDCVLIVRQRWADKRTEINDSMDTLLIFEEGEVIKRKPIRKMSPGCRHCKGYFSYEMTLSRATSSIREFAESKDEKKREIS